MHPMYNRRNDSRSQRSRTTIRDHHPRIPEALLITRLPRMGIIMYRRESCRCLLRCSAMGQEEHDAIYQRVLVDWWNQCQLYSRSWSEYCH